MAGCKLDRKPHRGAVVATAIPWLASLLLAGPGVFAHTHAGGDAPHHHHVTQEHGHHHWWWPWPHQHDHPHVAAAAHDLPPVVADAPESVPEALRSAPEVRDWHAAEVQHLHRTEPHAPGVLPPLVFLAAPTVLVDGYAHAAHPSRLRLTGLPAVRGPPASLSS